MNEFASQILMKKPHTDVMVEIVGILRTKMIVVRTHTHKKQYTQHRQRKRHT